MTDVTQGRVSLLAGLAAGLIRPKVAREAVSADRRSLSWKRHYDDLRDLPLCGEYTLLRAEVISRDCYLAEYQCPDGAVRHFGLTRKQAPLGQFWLCALASGDRAVATCEATFQQLHVHHNG